MAAALLHEQLQRNGERPTDVAVWRRTGRADRVRDGSGAGGEQRRRHD